MLIGLLCALDREDWDRVLHRGGGRVGQVVGHQDVQQPCEGVPGGQALLKLCYQVPGSPGNFFQYNISDLFQPGGNCWRGCKEPWDQLPFL